MSTYWYVFKRYGDPPHFRHYSYNSAENEARRLLESHGGAYEILKVEAVVKEAPKYVVEKPSDDNGDPIPF